MRRAGLGLALLVGTVGLAQVNTGWLSPSADSGGFVNGSWAYVRDFVNYAAAPHNAVHRYWGFSLSLPAGSTVLGIEVRLVFRKAGAPAAYLAAELSWDGGTSWTATGYEAGPVPGAWRDRVLGGSTDTWGRSWSPDELTSTAFRIRLAAVNVLDLDWVAVRVHYQPPGGVALVVSPHVVDLGTLDLADYDAGWSEVVPAQRITVSNATGWSLYVAADSATWSYTGPGPNPGKPCSHLEWRVVAFGPGVTAPQTSYVGLSLSPQRVSGGSAGTGLWLEVALRLVVDYATTVPGGYELRFTYTLTAP